MTNTKSLWLGIAIGGTVSAVITLLSTPSSGRKLREQMMDKGLEWKDMLLHLKQDGLRLKNQIKETSQEGAALMKELTRDMKKSVTEWKATVEPHQENIYLYLEQIESSLKDLEDKVKKHS